ncbi:uncharacterized protein LOC125225368 [Leguminivora glycinivorella]|nr:uncharacterized protein LOC125225368 [Leguminivora glycinivorella]
MSHSSSSTWTEALPLILLGIRSAVKEDLQATPAELVYGETLRLPGQFLSPMPDYKVGDVTEYATRLRSHMANLSPRPASWHIKSTPFYIPRGLETCSHVFLRVDRVRSSLEPPYEGPYKVMRRQKKFYSIDIKGKLNNVTVDRLKPAYIMREESPQPPELGSNDVDVEKQTRSGRHVRFPARYRP